MNIGFDVIQEIERVKETALKLGFVLAKPNYRYNDESYISLIPANLDSLPIYTRDAELFCGKLGDVKSFLRGIEWARDYDQMIKLSTHKNREKKEQLVRNSLLITLLQDKNP